MRTMTRQTQTIAATLAGPGPCPASGQTQGLPERDGVLLNGTLIDGLDFDDTHGTSVVHCSTSACAVAAVWLQHLPAGAPCDPIRTARPAFGKMHTMRPPSLTVLLLVLIALSLPATAAPEAAISEREADIYATVINHGLDADAQTIVIAERTTGDPAALAGDAERGAAAIAELAVPPATFADWARRNARMDPLDRALNLTVTYQVLAPKTLAELFETGEPEAGWQQFFARFPGAAGLLRLSHVGFDETGQHALVYLEHQCGAECGTGRLVYLVHEATGWAIRNATLVWMTN